jgi:hypothetical protein
MDKVEVNGVVYDNDIEVRENVVSFYKDLY